MILRGQAACDKTGIPLLHAQAFQEVANETDTVIASRAVGIYATGLILEGYASKGFHNKAKSCNWGPMAGFVLDDPKFTKVGGTAKGQAGQIDALQHAIEEGATAVPLYISENRRKWLVDKTLIKFFDFESDANGSRLYYSYAPWGPRLNFKLKPERGGDRPEGATADMWSVWYRSADSQAVGRPTGNAQWTRVMAMRDPLCTIPATDYRAATTGDYDLFAAWASNAQYRPDTRDKRLVNHAKLEDNIRNNRATGEHLHLGNITLRLCRLRFHLNRAFRRRGYTGGDMVHHSDEGGRPFVTAIDLPIFAVVPGQTQCYCLETVEDLRQFITDVLDRRYAPVFNPGWMNQLVFGNNGGALKQDLLATRGRTSDVRQVNAIRDLMNISI